MTPEQELVSAFFKRWELGSYAELRGAYAEFLSEDCVYENSGVPPCYGRQEALNFIDLAQQAREPLHYLVMPQRSLWGVLARRRAKIKAGCP